MGLFGPISRGLFPTHGCREKSLERFPAKWTSGSPEKTRPNKNLGRVRDSIQSEHALVGLFLCRLRAVIAPQQDRRTGSIWPPDFGDLVHFLGRGPGVSAVQKPDPMLQ